MVITPLREASDLAHTEERGERRSRLRHMGNSRATSVYPPAVGATQRASGGSSCLFAAVTAVDKG